MNQNHIKEIKAKHLNKISKIRKDRGDYEEKYFEICNILDECQSEIDEYKLRFKKP